MEVAAELWLQPLLLFMCCSVEVYQDFKFPISLDLYSLSRISSNGVRPTLPPPKMRKILSCLREIPHLVRWPPLEPQVGLPRVFMYCGRPTLKRSSDWRTVQSVSFFKILFTQIMQTQIQLPAFTLIYNTLKYILIFVPNSHRDHIRKTEAQIRHLFCILSNFLILRTLFLFFPKSGRPKTLD